MIIFGKSIFEWTLKSNGFNITLAQKKLKQLQTAFQNSSSDYVKKHLEDILRFHASGNPMISSNETVSNWERIPILTKANLQKPLKDRLTNGQLLQNVYQNKTSGSSGHPFTFAISKDAHALTWANIESKYASHGLDIHKSLQARFYGIPLDKIGYFKETLKDQLSSRERFPIFDLSDEKLDAFLSRFKKRPFEYLNGYTSSLVLFGKYLQSKNIILKNVCPTLKICITTSEMLFEEDRTLLEKWFGITIVNEYGASELGLIAIENTSGQMQVCEELLYIEAVDENNKPVPDGQPGKLLLTSFFNKAHPFIRYEIGDIGVLGSNYSGKRIIKKLVGRTNDIAYLPNGQTIPGLTFYYVTKSAIDDAGSIKEFIIVQEKPNSFLIKYVAETDFNSNQKTKILNALATYVGSGLQVKMERTEILDRSNRGKLKQFISLVKGA